MRRKHNRVQVGISQPYAVLRSVGGVTDVRTDTVPVRPAGSLARRHRGGRAGAAAGQWGGYAGYFSDPDGHLWKVATNA